MKTLKQLGRFLWRNMLAPVLFVAMLPVTIPLVAALYLMSIVADAWKDAEE
jgi:hypothetical protein